MTNIGGQGEVWEGSVPCTRLTMALKQYMQRTMVF